MSAAPTCLHHILVRNAAVSAVQTSWSEYISYSVSAVIELAIMDDTSRPIWVTIATDSNAIAEAKAKLINGGAYCHSCFSISKNFTTVFPNAVLQRQGKEPVVEWEIRLEDLVIAVEKGCQFCSFMACRFFDDPCFTFMYGKATSSTRVACCSKASRVDTTDFVLEALKNIRKFLTNHPDTSFTLVMQLIRPEDSLCDDGQRVKLIAYQSSLSDEDVKSLLGYRRHINLEFYALPSKTPDGIWFNGDGHD